MINFDRQLLQDNSQRTMFSRNSWGNVSVALVLCGACIGMEGINMSRMESAISRNYYTSNAVTVVELSGI